MYPLLNGTLASQNLGYYFLYLNQITSNVLGGFVFWVVTAFFLIILIGSLVAQQRFSGRIKFEISLSAALFATLGLSFIFEMVAGLFSPVYFVALIGLNILSFLWLILSSE